MRTRIQLSRVENDGFVLPIYPEDEIRSDSFELKLARWICQVDPQVCHARLAALDVVLYGTPSDCGRGTLRNDYVESADKFGVSLEKIHIAMESMPHIPAIHVGWRAGYNSGRNAGLRARGMTRTDLRAGVKAMLAARCLTGETSNAA